MNPDARDESDRGGVIRGMKVRPEIYSSIPWSRPKDLMGRNVPRRMSVWTILRSLPTPGGIFTDVPPEFWEPGETDPVKTRLGDERTGYGTATIKCLCGTEPVVEIGTMRKCEGCDRFFFCVGEKVMVANSPVPPPK